MASRWYATRTRRRHAARLLREVPVPATPFHGVYENGGSERVSKGAILTAVGTRWYCKLEVPIAHGSPALLTIEREGAGEGLAPGEATVVVPPGEADTLLALLKGIIEQARADGVLDESNAPR